MPIFRSGHQLALLAHLFVHSGREFSLAELQRETRIPQATLSREISRLVRAGLLSARTAGRMKQVQANIDSPYFRDLQALLLKTAGPAALLQERLADVKGVEEGYVFGSWARRYEGELGPPPGDIDLLVIGDPDPDAVDRVCSAVQRQLGQEVNAVILPSREWKTRRSGFVRQVRRGPLVPVTGAG